MLRKELMRTEYTKINKTSLQLSAPLRIGGEKINIIPEKYTDNGIFSVFYRLLTLLRKMYSFAGKENWILVASPTAERDSVQKCTCYSVPHITWTVQKDCHVIMHDANCITPLDNSTYAFSLPRRRP